MMDFSHLPTGDVKTILSWHKTADEPPPQYTVILGYTVGHGTDMWMCMSAHWELLCHNGWVRDAEIPDMWARVPSPKMTVTP